MGPVAPQPGFDDTLAKCGQAAVAALTQPAGWSRLEGRTKECYQRLLTLVSFMYMADGVNSEKVWHCVSDYVARVRAFDHAEAAQRTAPNTEPFAVCGGPAGIHTASRGVGPPPGAAMPSSCSAVNGVVNQVQASSPPMCGHMAGEEPAAKKARAGSGHLVPARREMPPTPGLAPTPAPFGALSRPHQFLIDMAADNSAGPPQPLATTAPGVACASGGALRVWRVCCNWVCIGIL